MVQKLRKLGFDNAFHVDGGWYAWEDAGYPVDPIDPLPPEAEAGEASDD